MPVHEGRDNVLAWHYDQHGTYSVCSAYEICRADTIRRRDQTSAQGGSRLNTDPMWDRIWKLKCPNKIKHFLWCFIHNSHPLRCNLARKGMRIDTICPVCERTNEDGGHLFFKCRLVERVWQALKLERERAALARLQSARDAIEAIWKEKEERRLLMIITIWFLWAQRNARW